MSADLIKLCSSAIDMEWVKKHTLALNALERATTNQDFKKSTDYLLKLMEEAGFSQIERYALPCDGETTYDDCTMPLAWDRTGRSTLEIISPEKQLLADSDAEPISSAIWSPPTPPGGVTAELVSLRSAVSDDWHELAGKIVLWDNSPSGPAKIKLANSGALGIVAYVDSIYDTNPDDIRWMNGSGLRGWYYTKDDPKMWVFSITPRNGRALEARLAAGEKITVKAVMNTKVAPGEIYTVTGVIPGKTSQEHALFAHMYEPFQADDAAGMVLSVAVGKALRELSEKGAIPALEKGLRVAFSMERFGFSEFFLNRTKNIVSAVNMDSVCHKSLKLAGVPLELRHSPASAPHFDMVILRNLLRANYPELTARETPGNLSDDTFSADAPYNVPCCWVHTPPAAGRHHNTGPVFNDADWEIAAAVTTIMTAYHAKLNSAAAGATTAELLAEIREGVFADAAADFERLQKTGCSADERKIIGDFLSAYHTARITAFNVICPGAVDEKETFAAVEKLRPAASEADAMPLLPAEHPMRKQIVTRASGVSQLMSFARMPRLERYARVAMPEMLFLALLDGKRTLHEAYIISNFFLKRTPAEGEADSLVKTFEFLAKYGYYTILPIR